MTSNPNTRTHRTLEERKARAEALQASIAEQVDALRNSAQWDRFLAFAGSFHHYSLNNLLLILAQRPDATAVAGYRAWQAKGRQVRAGEHGIHIFGYRQQTNEPDIDDTDREPETPTPASARTITRYPIVTVFDITQTDPIDGVENPSTIAQPLTGADDHGITDALNTHLTSHAWTVTRAHLTPGLNGYTDPDRRAVILAHHLSPEHAAKTLIHETAHIILNHTDDPEAYVQHRGLAETEAESVAYVVAGLAGIDTASYSIGYIAGWADGNTALITHTAGRVLRAVHTIADILYGTATAE